MSIAIPFPEELPEGYQWLGEETPFDPAKHLALIFLARIIFFSIILYHFISKRNF